MSRSLGTRCIIASAALLLFTSGTKASPQSPVPLQVAEYKEGSVMTKAVGTFEVTLTPQASDEVPEGAALGRLSIVKQFHGDLEGTSVGTMLTAGSSQNGSAGYVAVERVTGSLHGRGGTFVLQHNGTMNRGSPSLTIHVVPDSGTGDLTGLSGAMTIIIADGKHSYELEYALAKSP